MAGTAPFCLFKRQPTTVTDVRPSMGSRVVGGGGGGGGAVGAGETAAAAGDWSGPMLPLEVRRTLASAVECPLRLARCLHV